MFSQIGPDRHYNQNFLTFNSLNSYILKGDAAQGMELTFATLMARSGDEPDAMYGLAAAKVRRSADGLTYRFFIRPEAKFHDGSPLTAHDVAFSLNILKEKGHPLITQSLRDFTGATADDDATVTVDASRRNAPATCRCSSPACRFFRAPITRRSRSTNRRSTFRSAPAPTRSAASSRAASSNTSASRTGGAPNCRSARGLNNFDIVRFEYYRDRDVGFEGFTAENYLFREEFTSRTWATRYDFPAVKDGRVKKDVLPDDTPSGAQGWFINTRRAKFADPRLREALCNAFDFEWTNKTIMYGVLRAHRVGVPEFGHDGQGQAERRGTHAARAVPRPHARRGVRRALHAAGLGRLAAQDRALLRKASQLLNDAGCDIEDGKRVLPNGEPITIEFLIDEPTFEPHHMPFIKNLGVLGIDAFAAHRRPGAIPRASRRLRFRHHRRPLRLFRHARRFAALVLFFAGGGAEGLKQPRRHCRSGDRRTDRRHHRRADAARADDRLPRARPRDPRRPILDSALVQAVALDRLLGRVRAAAVATPLFPRHSRNLVV